MKYNEFSRYEGSPRRLCAVIPKTTTAPIYICPAGKRAQIMLVSVCNLTATAATVRLHHVTVTLDTLNKATRCGLRKRPPTRWRFPCTEWKCRCEQFNLGGRLLL